MKYRCKGTITVFLSLISVLLLSLLCTMIESSRVQGTRAKAAAALDMGVFSLFGEYENRLLEKYDVFGLDGGCGNGQYCMENLELKLKDYMRYNTAPGTGLMFRGFDPFPVSIENVQIKGVCLLSDENGGAFYQQAVGFMHDNLATETVNLWLERKQEADALKQAAEDYKQGEASNRENLKEVQRQKKEAEKLAKEKEEEEKRKAEELGIEYRQEEKEEKKIPKSENPLETIKKIKNMGITGLALGEHENVSEKTIPGDVVSKRTRQKGSIPVERKYNGLGSDLLFQEYLMEHFSCFGEEQTDGTLDYELEYLFGGKNSDEKNLKNVLKKLLLIREGSNFAFLCSNSSRMTQAEELAMLIAGAIPIPGMVYVVTYALLFVWAYAESIVDLRILMSGGRIPVWKDDRSWRTDLTDIPSLIQILNGVKGGGEGLTYRDYLQILLVAGSKSHYPLRALDLIECDLQKNLNPGFKADHAIVTMKTEADYRIPPMFLRVSDAFLNTGTAVLDYKASGTFAY